MPRPVHKYHFIYKTTNLINGKYYYGMHSCSNLDDGYLGSGLRLNRSIKKYGRENFKREILEFCNDRKDLKKRESEIVTLNEIAKTECLNLQLGGEGGFSIEQQKINSKNGKIKIRFLMENDHEWLQKRFNNMSSSQKNSYLNPDRKTWKGRKHTKETIDKMKKSNKGKRDGNNNSQFGTCWINKENENKKIKKELLEHYLTNGWNRGRQCKKLKRED